ncbi:hypothetical protein EUX98_g7312 [Antrodiella citrinella]|uniref:Uncharacterized protein n=1 Tax=Antrodiella citrinella TaxID=2447956 RepID=A0A4S4MLV1_9APHY|nr:hypothetical protein EUX98_g7312 [Antrodiella citrinella]
MSDSSQPPKKRKPNINSTAHTGHTSSKAAVPSKTTNTHPSTYVSAPVRPRAASVQTEEEEDAELEQHADEIIEIESDDDDNVNAMEVDHSVRAMYRCKFVAVEEV